MVYLKHQCQTISLNIQVTQGWKTPVQHKKILFETLSHYPILLLKIACGVPIVAQWKRIHQEFHEVVGSMLSGLTTQCCRELQCRSQMQLGSGVAVALAQAAGYSSNWTPSLGTSMCRGKRPQKKAKKGQKKKKKNLTILYLGPKKENEKEEILQKWNLQNLVACQIKNSMWVWLF